MRTFDGLQSKPTSHRAHQAVSTDSRSRGSGWLLFGILLALFALFLIRPMAPSSIPTEATPIPKASENTFTLPSAPQAEGDIVILDQPTTESKLQPSSTPTSPTPFTVRILNGGGPQGAAAELRDQFMLAQYTVSGIGNAQNTHQQTTIYFMAGSRDIAERMNDEFSLSARFVEDSIADPDTLLIVIGIQ